ncbi:MAG: ABC transporter substrate-binding protein [Peptococcaceae bacterium]|nr:ABC transporter substrate-binding protein [Peptococcaceae bacterium]
MRRIIIPLVLLFIIIGIGRHLDRNATPGSSSQGSNGRVLVVALPETPETLHPEEATKPAEMQVLRNVYEGLVRFAPGSTKVEPCLATAWEVSPDARRWTFQLRRNVIFHDGTPLTAEYVKMWAEKRMAAKDKYPYGNFIFGPIERVEVINKNSVRFYLRYPYAPFIRNLAMLPAALTGPTQTEGLPAGTGPFRLAAPHPRQPVLTAFPHYWGPQPRADVITFKVIPEEKQRLAMAAQGKVDIANDVTPQKTPTGAGYYIKEGTGLSTGYLGFYTDKPPFDNPQLRRAICYAIDRRALVNKLFRYSAVPACGPIPPGVLGYDDALECHPYDPEKAMRLIEETGWSDRSVTIITYHGPRPYNPAGGPSLAAAIRDQLELVGIEVKIIVYPWKECKAAIHRREGDLFLYGWVSDNGDPDNFTYNLLATSQIECGLNTARYANPEADLLMAQAQQTTDEETRASLYHKAQEIIIRDAPWICLNYGLRAVALHSDIERYIFQPSGGAYLNLVSKREWR